MTPAIARRLLLSALCLLLLPMCDRITQSRVQGLISSGRYKQSLGDYAGAVEDLTAALSLDPKNREAYLLRGVARSVLGQPEAALVDLDAAIKLAPEAADGHFQRALLMEGQGDDAAALADLERALKLDANYGEAYALRGFLRTKAGDKDGALADFDRAIELEPEKPAAYEYRSWVRLERKEYDAALADLNRAAELRPGSASPYQRRAHLKREMGDDEGALADLDRAVARDAEGGATYKDRGILKMGLGRWEAAVADLRTYVESAGEDEREYPHLFVWICQTRLGETEAADEELAAFFKGRPAEAWPGVVAGHLLDRVPEAEFLAAAATARDGMTVPQLQCEAWYYAGVKRLLSGDRTGAATAFRNCQATKVEDFVEHDLAGRELRRLEGAGEGTGEK